MSSTSPFRTENAIKRQFRSDFAGRSPCSDLVYVQSLNKKRKKEKEKKKKKKRLRPEKKARQKQFPISILGKTFSLTVL